jgi:retron-type reverse transcriptase
MSFSEAFPGTGSSQEVVEQHYGRGVPQGSPTSPILAILALEAELMYKVSVQYADDGLKGSDQPCELKLSRRMTKNGIEVADDKSGYIKFQGK